jgi:hypothetical protein
MVRSLTNIGNDLYVGGMFTRVGNDINANRIAKYDIKKTDDSGWSSLGNGINEGNLNGSVLTMSIIDSSLYIGGNFETAGDISANNIVKYTL